MIIRTELPEIFEQFGEQKRKSYLEIKDYKDKGHPVVGMYCAYFPTELAMAVDAIPVGLCSFSNEPVLLAEQEMPKSMCPLVKSSYGFARSDKCPFFYFADLVIGETTCDGKKKLYEMLAEFKPVHVMELPNSQSEDSLEFWKKQVIRTKEYFEDFFGKVITDEKIREANHLQNEIRGSLKRFCEVMKNNPAPISGLDVYKVLNGCKYRFDFKTTPEVVNGITDRIMEEYANGKMLDYRARILVTGCPIGGDTVKIIEAIENHGGVVVALENCSGVKTLDRMVDETNPDPYEALARRYLSTGCSIMTPNNNRIELIGRIIDEYQIDGVVEMVLSGCHATGAESFYIKKFVNDERHLPYICITTDYSAEDKGQIDTRIEAFLEMISLENQSGRSVNIYECYKMLTSALAEKKKFESVVSEISEYTGIAIALADKDKVINKAVGVPEDAGDDYFKDAVELEIERVKSYLLGVSSKGHNSSSVKEVLGVVARAGEMLGDANLLFKENEVDEESTDQIPDYMWVVISATEDETAAMTAELRENRDNLIEVRSEKGNASILLDHIAGNDDREAIIEQLIKINDEFGNHVTFGSGFSRLDDKEENLKMTAMAHNIAKEKEPEKDCHRFEDFYLEIMSKYFGQKYSADKCDLPQMRILRQEDAEKSSELYETYHVYLRMRRNTSATAAKLNIHRNTLLYRLDRIQELIQMEDREEEEYDNLLFAMDIAENL